MKNIRKERTMGDFIKPSIRTAMLFGFSRCAAVIDLLMSLFGLRVHSYDFLNQSVIKPAKGRKTNRL